MNIEALSFSVYNNMNNHNILNVFFQIFNPMFQKDEIGLKIEGIQSNIGQV